MSMAVFTRDDFAQLMFREDFFATNPAFASIQDTVVRCKAAYLESKAKSSCGCGGGAAQNLFACMDAALELMERLRTENPEALTTLVTYIGGVRDDPRINLFALYYRKTAETPLLKVRFP
jgi:hypothetical protein